MGPQLDAGIKNPGRGAYICPERSCLELAVKKGAVARALHKPCTAAQANQFLKSGLARISEKQNGKPNQ